MPKNNESCCNKLKDAANQTMEKAWPWLQRLRFMEAVSSFTRSENCTRCNVVRGGMLPTTIATAILLGDRLK